jgi:hypothetical protein
MLIHGLPLMYSKEKPQEQEDDEEEGVDGEILSGMFTAIQDLIDDTFHTEGGEGQTKKRIEFGGKNVMIQRGENAYLVFVVEGRPGKILEKNMEKTINNIEQGHSEFEEWDGDRDLLDMEPQFEMYL